MDATKTTAARNATYLNGWAKTGDHEAAFARRGFACDWGDDRIVRAADNREIWNFRAYDYVDGEAPPSVNPSLWRHAKLLKLSGLFEVHPRIWQIRGFDLSNLTVIVGDTGYIVIDPLISTEVAAAAMELVRRQLGDKPVKAVIYTHSHVDHFGGVKGVITQADADSGRVPVIAPQGFLHYAVAENVIAGPAMLRRSTYMYGSLLPRHACGQCTTGLGPAVSLGTVSLIAPTLDITHTGQKLTVDGVEIEFQLTPETEAPAEMNFFFPQFGALCLAENANGSLHNVLTPRGALVRDAKAWGDYLTQAWRLFGARTDVMFTSHFWPRWGRGEIESFVLKHRDLYRYLHDQSVRLMNQGLVGEEIAEALELPPAIAAEWFNRGYYGHLKFNARAVYQRYLGFFDGNPANLDKLPPVDAGKRYVDFMGGADAVLEKAQVCFDEGDYRWTAQVVSHVVFADPANQPARELLAQSFEQLGYQAENAVWRNFYLMGAQELRTGVLALPLAAGGAPELMAAMSPEMILDLMSVRLNPEKAGDRRITLGLTFTDFGRDFTLTLANAVLIAEPGRPTDADARVSLARMTLLPLATRARALEHAQAEGKLAIDGNAAAFVDLIAMLDPPGKWFGMSEP
jgi:alkyl sulfatase BDS1-like metallo-beta-lactamase superfamily hydrolase